MRVLRTALERPKSKRLAVERVLASDKIKDAWQKASGSVLSKKTLPQVTPLPPPRIRRYDA